MRIPIDRLALVVLLIGALFVFGRAWLYDHPQHDPWAPLAIGDPPGWATQRKLAVLRGDPEICRAFLTRSNIAFTALPPAGEGACRRDDRQTLAPDKSAGLVLRPAGAQATCAVGAALAWWMRHGVEPAAQTLFGQRVVTLEHLGTHNCRRIGGGAQGTWSEHATGNAIDIAAFVLADGRRVVVRRDWNGTSDEAAFLRTVRDGACEAFGTVLSPDYNAAHADHFHLDQAQRGAGWSYCR